MNPETHAFKALFATGAAAGFVVRAGQEFVERRGEQDAYLIFEDRGAAERALAEIAEQLPSSTRLCVQEVTVESVRDYQRLKGFKTIYLVDRAGRTASSLRMGEMPLAARTQTPFPGPLPAGVRITAIPAKPAGPAEPPAGSEVRPPTPPKPSDPAEQKPPSHSDRPGLFARLLRLLRGKA